MKEIKLTQGKVALVDDEDYERVSKYKWCFDSGYAGRNKKLNNIDKMHRFILDLTDTELEVDHKDGDGLNNQKGNLRIGSHESNMHNKRRYKNNKSGFKGVYWFKKDSKWGASIQHKKKRIFLGLFEDKEEAARAYDKKSRELRSNDSFLNFD